MLWVFICLLLSAQAIEVSIGDLIQVYELGKAEAEAAVGGHEVHGPEDNNCLAAIAIPQGSKQYSVVDNFGACEKLCVNHATCNGFTFHTDPKFHRCWIFEGVEEWKDCGKNKSRRSKWWVDTADAPAAAGPSGNCNERAPQDDNCLAAIAIARGSSKYVVVDTYDLCKQECLNYDGCNGLTYHKELHRCWIFEGVEEWKDCGKNKSRRSEFWTCNEAPADVHCSSHSCSSGQVGSKSNAVCNGGVCSDSQCCDVNAVCEWGSCQKSCTQTKKKKSNGMNGGSNSCSGSRACEGGKCKKGPLCQQKLDEGMTCMELVEHHVDVSECDCEDKCTQVCQQYLDTGYSCQECTLAGLTCSPCDECGGCACQKYLDEGWTCAQVEAAGLDCSGCECSGCAAQAYFNQGLDCVYLKQVTPPVDLTGCGCEDVCAYQSYLDSGSATCKQLAGKDLSGCQCENCVNQEYFNAGHDCVDLKQAGMDTTGCGCDDVCACHAYLSQGATCEQLEAQNWDCSACDCTPKCPDSCTTNIEQGWSCDDLAKQGLDCSMCDCTPRCSATCQQNLGTLTCEQLKSYGYDCSICPEC